MTSLLDDERLDAHEENLVESKKLKEKRTKKKKRKSEGDGEDGGLKKEKKAKKSDAGAFDLGVQASGDGGSASAKKKKKRPQKKSAAAYAASLEASRTIAKASAEEQSAWLWSSCEETLKLSAAELAGLYDGDGGSSPSSSVLLLPASLARSAPSLEDLIAAADPNFAAELTRPRSFSNDDGGATSAAAAKPLVVVVSPSANNALACIRSLPRTSANSHVAKLFARHIKIAEQESLLREKAREIRAAAGTPARIDALASSSSSSSDSSPSLDLGSLRLLVLDVSLDAKQRTLLDIPETRGDFWGMFKRHAMERVKRGECRVALFDSGAKGRETTKEVMEAKRSFEFGGGGRGGGGRGGRFGSSGRGFGGGGRGGFGGRGRGRW